MGKDGAYTDQDLRDSILNFMMAGRDTTAITLSWFIYCVCKHPEVGERICKETLQVLGLEENYHCLDFEEVAKRITYDALGNMHYLHAALTETLRLYPAVPRVNMLSFTIHAVLIFLNVDSTLSMIFKSFACFHIIAHTFDITEYVNVCIYIKFVALIMYIYM